MNENALIAFIPGTLPVDFCPAGEQERYNMYVSLLSGFLPGNFSTWNTGSSEPTVENRALPWHRTNADGSPDRDYDYYNGSWVSRHLLDPSTAVRWIWVGTTGDLENFDGGAPGTVSDDTGPMWEVDTDFSGKIPRGADGTVPVSTNANELSSGSSASDQVRGIYLIKRTARRFYVA